MAAEAVGAAGAAAVAMDEFLELEILLDRALGRMALDPIELAADPIEFAADPNELAAVDILQSATIFSRNPLGYNGKILRLLHTPFFLG